MTNVTPLNIPHQQQVNKVVDKILRATEGESNEVVLAAFAEIVTVMSTMDLTGVGIGNAYRYIVNNAHDASKEVWVKVAPKPSNVTPLSSPE